MKFHFKFFKTLLFLLPFILGTLGFAVLEKRQLADSMFNSILMYLFGYSDGVPNVLIEIARWTAPLATASGVIFAVNRLKNALKNRVRYWRGNSVAVYGPEEQRNILLKQLGRRGIEGQDTFVKAQRYILVDEEQKNINFYWQYKEQLSASMVYMKCNSFKAQITAGSNLRLFNEEETAARVFWKQKSLYQQSAARGHRLRIVWIGFGRLGEELLTWGLQNLIFSPDQVLEYHIFGDGSTFLGTHPYLNEIHDPLHFYKEPWYQQISLIESADLVLVVEQEKQQALLNNLLSVLLRDAIDVFPSDPASLSLLEGKERLRPFAWEIEDQKLENIFADVLLERAKRINLRYAHLYNGVEETEEMKEAEWEKLDSFTRYSNISAADYHEVRLHMLPEGRCEDDASGLDSDTLELFAELEHIRWCRYHYLNNWHYGVPSGGRAKDKEKRIHTDLIPYHELTDEDKEKDRENIRILLSLG